MPGELEVFLGSVLPEPGDEVPEVRLITLPLEKPREICLILPEWNRSKKLAVREMPEECAEAIVYYKFISIYYVLRNRSPRAWEGREKGVPFSRTRTTPLYNWDGRSVRHGSSRYGTVLYNYDGQYLRKGSGAYSTPILNVSGTVPIAILILIQVM